MKKLMTMLAAVATAFGLYAADSGFISGAAFDTTDKGTDDNLTWVYGTGLQAGYWFGDTANAVWTNETSVSSDSTMRPAYYLYADNPTRSYSGYLAIATTNGLVVGQKVLPAGDPQAIDDGLYFDGLVNFTSFDENPVIANNAKIAVFPMLEDPEADSSDSYLMVKAWGTMTNIWKTALQVTDGTWHRVTIKMIDNILKNGSQVGFVVYVDGEAVGLDSEVTSDFNAADLTLEAQYYNAAGQLFGSLGKSDDLQNPEVASITEVGFAGKGAIDEIAFTTTAPDFAVSPAFAEITVGSNINSFSIYEDGVLAGTYTTFPITIEKKDDVEYAYTYIAAPGYVSVKTQTSLDLSEGSATIDNATAAAALLGEEGYATIADAVVEANKATESVVLKIVTVASGDEDVALDNEFVTLDLNGLQGIGEIGFDGCTKGLTLTNSSDTVAAVDGCVWPTVAINSDKMKFLAEQNEDMSGDCSITVSSFADNWELKKVGLYYEVSPKASTGTVIFICDKPAYEGSFEGDIGGDITVPTDFPAAFKMESWTNGEGVAASELKLEDGMQFSPKGLDINLEKVGSDYQVTSAADLQKLQAFVAAEFDTTDMSFKQTQDIDMTSAGVWTGIGLNPRDNSNKVDANKAFKGTYDGQGHKISNVVFQKQKAQGLFSVTLGATIQDLIVKDITFGGTGSSWGGAAFVGYAQEGTKVIRCTAEGNFGTDSDPIAHCAAGIAYTIDGYTTPTEFIDCTNNMNIVISDDKIAGIAVINGGTANDTAVAKFVRCVNNGSLISKKGTAGDGEANGGILGYKTASKVVIEDCVNNGEQSGLIIGSMVGWYQGGGSLVGEGANKASASIKPVGAFNTGYSAANAADFAFATVDGDVATFVADNALALNGAYKVMVGGAAPTFEFTEAGTIAFNTNLFFVADFSGITVDDDTKWDLTSDEDAGIVTFTCAAKSQEEPIVPGEPEEFNDSDKADARVAEINADKAKFIELPADFDGASIDKATYVNYVEAKRKSDGESGYLVVIDITTDATYAPIVQTNADAAEAAIDPATIADGTADSATITAIPGLYYSVVEGATLEGMAEGNRVPATSTSISLPLTKYPTAGFYRVKISAAPKK